MYELTKKNIQKVHTLHFPYSNRTVFENVKYDFDETSDDRCCQEPEPKNGCTLETTTKNTFFHPWTTFMKFSNKHSKHYKVRVIFFLFSGFGRKKERQPSYTSEDAT